LRVAGCGFYATTRHYVGRDSLSSSAGLRASPPVRRLKQPALGDGLPTSPPMRCLAFLWLPVGAHRRARVVRTEIS